MASAPPLRLPTTPEEIVAEIAERGRSAPRLGVVIRYILERAEEAYRRKRRNVPGMSVYEVYRMVRLFYAVASGTPPEDVSEEEAELLGIPLWLHGSRAFTASIPRVGIGLRPPSYENVRLYMHVLRRAGLIKVYGTQPAGIPGKYLNPRNPSPRTPTPFSKNIYVISEAGKRLDDPNVVAAWLNPKRFYTNPVGPVSRPPTPPGGGKPEKKERKGKKKEEKKPAAPQAPPAAPQAAGKEKKPAKKKGKARLGFAILFAEMEALATGESKVEEVAELFAATVSTGAISPEQAWLLVYGRDQAVVDALAGKLAEKLNGYPDAARRLAGLAKNLEVFTYLLEHAEEFGFADAASLASEEEMAGYLEGKLVAGDVNAAKWLLSALRSTEPPK